MSNSLLLPNFKSIYLINNISTECFIISSSSTVSKIKLILPPCSIMLASLFSLKNLEVSINHFHYSCPNEYPNRLLCLCSFSILIQIHSPQCCHFTSLLRSSRVVHRPKIKSRVFDLTFRKLFMNSVKTPFSNLSHHYCQHDLSAPVTTVLWLLAPPLPPSNQATTASIY